METAPDRDAAQHSGLSAAAHYGDGFHSGPIAQSGTSATDDADSAPVVAAPVKAVEGFGLGTVTNTTTNTSGAANGDTVDVDEEVVKLEKYFAWKHNSPLLYDALLVHHCHWPALAMQWGPLFNTAAPPPDADPSADHGLFDDDYGRRYFTNQTLYFSQQTDGRFDGATQRWTGRGGSEGGREGEEGGRRTWQTGRHTERLGVSSFVFDTAQRTVLRCRLGSVVAMAARCVRLGL
jgi:hypothetical protein